LSGESTRRPGHDLRLSEHRWTPNRHLQESRRGSSSVESEGTERYCGQDPRSSHGSKEKDHEVFELSRSTYCGTGGLDMKPAGLLVFILCFAVRVWAQVGSATDPDAHMIVARTQIDLVVETTRKLVTPLSAGAGDVTVRYLP